jgi:hypothetical protein
MGGVGVRGGGKEVTDSLFHFLALACLNKGKEIDWGVGEKWEGGV